MPCYDPPYHDPLYSTSEKDLVRIELLCDACQLLEQHGLLEQASEDVKQAYAKHRQTELPSTTIDEHNELLGLIQK